jgi:hypothetical protein
MDINTSGKIFKDLVKVMEISGIHATKSTAEEFVVNISQMDTETLRALINSCTQELFDRAMKQ